MCYFIVNFGHIIKQNASICVYWLLCFAVRRCTETTLRIFKTRKQRVILKLVWDNLSYGEILHVLITSSLFT